MQDTLVHKKERGIAIYWINKRLGTTPTKYKPSQKVSFEDKYIRLCDDLKSVNNNLKENINKKGKHLNLPLYTIRR